MARWFEEYRLAWIAETLLIFGFINREHLVRKFGISIPQASIDLRTFQCRYPGSMSYDRASKQYVSRKVRQAGVKR